MSRSMRWHRHGAVLLVVVGLSAVLLAMSLAYLATIRIDAAAVRVLTMQAQSRVMVDAACLYILECGRIGWGEEAFGWLDIRDAQTLDRTLAPLNGSGAVVTYAANPLPGPRGLDGRQLPKLADGCWAVNASAPAIRRWPALGGVARVTMLPPVLPPYATMGKFSYNPVPASRAAGVVNSSSVVDMVQYTNLDPQPAGVFPDPEPGTGSAWTYPVGSAATWAQGGRSTATDPASLAQRSRGATGWFRVFRSHFDTFIICVGAGGSQGYRDWSEVQADGATNQFFDDQLLFEGIRADDTRMWYEARWSPSVATRVGWLYAGQAGLGDKSSLPSNQDNDTHYKFTKVLPGSAGLELIPPNFDVSHFMNGTQEPDRAQPINQLGTIAYIRRLNREPARW